MSDDIEHRACFDLDPPCGSIIDTHYGNSPFKCGLKIIFQAGGGAGDNSNYRGGGSGSGDSFNILPSKPLMCNPPQTEWPFNVNKEQKDEIEFIATFTCNNFVHVFYKNCGRRPSYPYNSHKTIDEAKANLLFKKPHLQEAKVIEYKNENKIS